MALWAKVQQLPQEFMSQVQSVYSPYFPMEVRHYFAAWIEDQPWKDIDDTNPQHEQIAIRLFAQLTELIEAKTNDNTLEFHLRSSLQVVAMLFKDAYCNQPMNLVRAVRNCLANEENLVRASETLSSPSMTSQAQLDEKTKQEIQGCMDLLDTRTNESGHDLRHMQLIQEKFVIDHQNQAKISASLAHVQQQPTSANRTEMETGLKQKKEEMDRQLLASAQQILQQRLALARKHKDTLATLESITKQIVVDELIAWKQKQKLSYNGAPFDTTMIDVLQKWCESLADLIWRNRMQIIEVDLLRQQLPIPVPVDASDGVTDLLPELNRTVTALLERLVTNALIVEHQPPQVVKKETGFTATVRLLVGGKLSLHLTPPRVQATFISEQQARNVIQNGVVRLDQKFGDILNNEGNMDYQKHSGQLSVTFRNMSLQSIKRADKKKTERVAEEKGCICFSSNFSVGGNELQFQVWTLSLPVVATVHVNQECAATATYLWDNQFSEQGRIPFQVSNRVPWSGVANMLSTKFCAMTGRGLSESNLKYLGNKLFGTSGIVDFSNAVVTWEEFSKKPFPGKKFTFWEWFWSIAKLVKEHLQGPWTDGSIIGFMDKTESNELLLSRPIGTFLLRFSDGTEGALTIAYVKQHPDKPGESQVWNLAPLSAKDFALRGLADRIKDLTTLVALYPDTPKHTAFQSYFSKPDIGSSQKVENGGYVKTKLIFVIDEQPSTQPPGEIDFNNPQTPGACAGPVSSPSYANQPGTLEAEATQSHYSNWGSLCAPCTLPCEYICECLDVRFWAMDCLMDLADLDFSGMPTTEIDLDTIDFNEILQ